MWYVIVREEGYALTGTLRTKEIPLRAHNEPLRTSECSRSVDRREGSGYNRRSMGITDKTWYVYLLQCADGTLYTGISVDPQRRLAQHNAGRGARYTRMRLPVRLLGSQAAGTQREAILLEKAIKRRSPPQKKKTFGV